MAVKPETINRLNEAAGGIAGTHPAAVRKRIEAIMRYVAGAWEEIRGFPADHLAGLSSVTPDPFPPDYLARRHR